MFVRRLNAGVAVALIASFLLVGCGAQGVVRDAQNKISAGDFEKGLQIYQDGVTRYPDDAAVRSGLLRAREHVQARLITAATSARAKGDDGTAQQALQRLLAISPEDDRAKSMMLELERDRRQKSALTNIRELLAKGLRERAVLAVEAALKDSPKNSDLLALQRQLELEAKQFEMGGMQLAESRPVSLDFRDANLRAVLDLLTRSSGVNFVLDKDVRPDTRATVVLRQTRVEDALTLIASTNQLAYKVIDPTTVLIYPKTPDKVKEYQDLMIRAFYLSSAEAKQTASLLKTMLKVKDPFIDEKLNMIMIRESPETIRLAERIVALHDMAEPEVMIELEVLEVKRSSLTELGIKYPDGLTFKPLPPNGASGFTLDNLRSLSKETIGVTLPDVRLNLHRDVGDVNLLANPQIRARNHEKANVMIGDKLPVVTTTGNAANSNFISESVQYVDVGLKLNVEPTIYLDDEVAIKVGLEVSSLVNEIKTTGGSLVYQIGTRSANTVLRLRNGETQLLAGLINNEERMSANRIPGAGDLPLIGRLFSSQRDSGQRTEIVLSVTPRILRNIRRPDLNLTEFWSGTENDLRSRPLVAQQSPAKPADTSGVAPTGPAQASATAPFALSLQAPATVKAGETFAVQVKLRTETPIRGIPVQLQYAKDKLEAIDAEEESFLKQDGAVTSATKVMEHGQGKASMAVLRNAAEGVAGEGTLMTFRFKALAAGQAEVRLASASAISSAPLVQPPLPASIKIDVK